MAKRYPEHYRLPTEGVLLQYKAGIEAGLVPAGHEVLRTPADEVPIEDITRRPTQRLVGRLWSAVYSLSNAGYGVAGLHAVQIGESAQVALVPDQFEKGKLMVVFNGIVQVKPGTPLGPIVPHGCHSGQEGFPKLLVPEKSVLVGYDINGNPIAYQRGADQTVVDIHEQMWHALGKRGADIAVDAGIQIDYRPPEKKDEYRKFFNGPDGFQANPEQPNWPDAYPHDQWAAVKAGEFVLADFLK